jgi:hypothetical protein
MKRDMYTLYILLFLTACSSKINFDNEKFERCIKLKIEVSNLICFPLDSITPSVSTMSQKFEDYYTFLSYGSPTCIHFYDIAKLKLSHSLFLEDLMNNVSGYLIHNLDSIFLFSYSENKIILINSQKRILNQWDLPPFRKNYLNSPRIVTGRPLLVKEGKIYCGGIGTGEPPENQKIITTVDMKSKNVETFLEYPDLYKFYNWGGANFRYIFLTKSFDDDILLSFPALHVIYKTPNFKEIYSFYGGSCEIKSISPLKGKLSKEKRLKHFQSNYSYRSIIADTYRDVYYRIYEKPIKYARNPPWYKPCGVIVLDKDFKYLGEFDLDMENISPSWHYTSFVSSQGLCIQMKSDSEEKYLNFLTIKYTTAKNEER